MSWDVPGRIPGGRWGFEYAAKINGMNIMLKFGFESIP
jgi:hypothetical protein